MNEHDDDMFGQAIETILADQCTPVAIRAIEGGGSAATLWSALADAGFLELMASEADGGAGLTLEAVYPIFVAFGRYAVPVPAAQSIAARVLLPAGVTVPLGQITLAGHCHAKDDGGVGAANVAFGATADYVLGNREGELLLLDCARATRTPTGVRGSLAASLHWPAGAVSPALGDTGSAVATFSAAIHAAAMAGAMERAFHKTLEYCNERIQFGKTIGKFQSVQHQLSVMAEHVACTGAAAELAFPAGGTIPPLLATAMAKARASMSVPLVASTAHALHGAIGVTEEFDLQLYTRRLHEWRVADGSEAYWNGVVGEALLASQEQSLLNFIAIATR